MNDRISEFLKYLKIEKNYSSNTIKNYEIDIDEFKNYLNCEGIDYLSVDYDFIKGFSDEACNKLNNERGKNDLKPRVQPSSASRTQVRTRRFFFVLRKKIKKNGQQPKNQQLENQSRGTAEQNARPVRSFRKCRKHSKSNTHQTRQCINQCRSNAFLLHFAPLSYRL